MKVNRRLRNVKGADMKIFQTPLTIGFVYSKWKERVKISEVWMTMLLIKISR